MKRTQGTGQSGCS